MAYGSGDVLTASDMNSVTGAWPTYTPTLTGITIGNGTTTARVLQSTHGGSNLKAVDFFVQVVFGSTTAMTGGFTVTLPVTARSSGLVFTAIAFDNSANLWYPMLGLSTTAGTTLSVRAWPTTAGNQVVITSSTVPFTWATSDQLTVMGRYEAA